MHIVPAQLRRRSQPTTVGLTALVVLMTSLGRPAAAPVRAENPSFGATQAMRQDAARNIPLTKLTQQGRALSSKVLNDPTVFRRLPTQTIECDAEMYAFLVEHPDLVINVWEVLGITKVSLKRTGPNSFRLDDGHGTTGELHFLYRSPSQYIVYCEGTYTGALFARPLRGRCLLSLRSTAVRDADEVSYMQCRLDSFVQIDNIGAEVFAKTFQSVLGGIADHNFQEISKFVATVSQAAETSPDNIDHIAAKLDRIDAPTKRQFSEIGRRVAARAAEAATTVASRPATR